MNARAALETAAGAAALVAASLLGDWISRRYWLTIPGTVLGLLLLLGGLLALGRVPAGLERASRFLIRHMNLFYVPAAVAITGYLGLLREDLWPISAALILGTWLALGAAGLTFRAVSRALERGG